MTTAHALDKGELAETAFINDAPKSNRVEERNPRRKNFFSLRGQTEGAQRNQFKGRSETLLVLLRSAAFAPKTRFAHPLSPGEKSH